MPYEGEREEWRDPADRLVATVWHDDVNYCFEVPGVARYACNTVSGTGTCAILGHSSGAIARDTFNRTILPFVLHALDFEALHASAVIIGDHVHAFCAPSGTGKSTLADGLCRRGHVVWTDDCLAMTQVNNDIATFAVPFHIRLAKSSPAWVSTNNYPADPDRVPETFDPANALTLPLGGIYMLHRGETRDKSPQLRLLTPSSALELLLTHAYAFSVSSTDRRRRMMTRFLNIAAKVPLYRLDVPNDPSQVEAILDFLEPILEQANPLQNDRPRERTSRSRVVDTRRQ